MSFSQQGTKAFNKRWEKLLSFWKEKRRGPYARDIAAWRVSEGLTPRTARENYWDTGEDLGIIRIVFEKQQQIGTYAKREAFWEYCGLNEKLEEGEESATEYMLRRKKEKEERLKNELRQKLKEA